MINHSKTYPNWRKSKVLGQRFVGKSSNILKSRILAKFRSIREFLGVNMFDIGDIEVQLTSHNDGDFFRQHSDSGSEATANRIITFVYYFYKDPKSFSKGELVLHSKPHLCNIEPLNDMIIFFRSDLPHEVLITECKSQGFSDSRFTLNGWIIRKNQ